MPYSTLTEEDLVRLVTVRFLPGRFKGRQALEAEAVRGDVVALAKLEIQLGLADKSALREAYERRLANVAFKPGYYKHGLSPEVLRKLERVPYGHRVPWILGMIARHEEVSEPENLVPPKDIEALQKKQKNRLYKAYTADDSWYESNTKLSTFEKFAKKKLENAARKSVYKRYRYTPTLQVRAVPVGEERVETRFYPGWLRRRVGRGWGNARKSEEYFDPQAWSKTTWYVSPALLSPETRERQMKNQKNVYLSPKVRVRRGRGRELITEIFGRQAEIDSKQATLPWGTVLPRWTRRS
jgi:hypothetical protein